jgi:hypothetical protein
VRVDACCFTEKSDKFALFTREALEERGSRAPSLLSMLPPLSRKRFISSWLKSGRGDRRKDTIRCLLTKKLEPNAGIVLDHSRLPARSSSGYVCGIAAGEFSQPKLI